MLHDVTANGKEVESDSDFLSLNIYHSFSCYFFNPTSFLEVICFCLLPPTSEGLEKVMFSQVFVLKFTPLSTEPFVHMPYPLDRTDPTVQGHPLFTPQNALWGILTKFEHVQVGETPHPPPMHYGKFQARGRLRTDGVHPVECYLFSGGEERRP